MHLPPIKMFDVEKLPLSVTAVKADGTVDETVALTWTSSAPDQVAIEPDAATNGRTAMALTPLDRGSATITVSAKGFESHDIALSYEPFVKGQLNLSAGSPIPDTE